MEREKISNLIANKIALFFQFNREHDIEIFQFNREQEYPTYITGNTNQ